MKSTAAERGCQYGVPRRSRAISTVALNICVTASCSMSRARFLLKAEWFHTASSVARPTNRRNSWFYGICPTSCRSLRTL